MNEMDEVQNEMMKVILLEPGKLARVTEIKPNLRDMQAVVRGDIEPAYFFDDPVCLVVNEEGKINGMRLNRGVYDDQKQLVDIIAGPAFLCRDAGDHFASLTDEQIKKYTEQFKYPERFIRVDGEIKGIKFKPEKEVER